MSSVIRNVLFIGAANASRSIIGEALANALGGGRFRGHSAGIRPSGRVDPTALDVLAASGCLIAGARSKPVSEFGGPGAPRMDFVIVVADTVALEALPVFPGRPVLARWSLADPSLAPDDHRRQAHITALRVLRRHIQQVTSLHLESLDGPVLLHELEQIGRG